MKTAVSYELVQEYILENNLTENDTIVLHPADYDTVATEYVIENNITIFRPVEILGVRIMEDTTGEVRKNHIYVPPLAAS
jgi:hypothetical protein